jgi:hypothetical protein
MQSGILGCGARSPRKWSSLGHQLEYRYACRRLTVGHKSAKQTVQPPESQCVNCTLLSIRAAAAAVAAS